MRRDVLFTWGGILLLSTLWATPALTADTTPLKIQMICDSDGNTIFGELGEGEGTAIVSEDGKLKFDFFGLAPNTTYTCELTCASGGHFLSPCTTDAKGQLHVVFKGVASPDALGGGCLLPTPSLSGEEDCLPGYGTVGTGDS